MADLIKEERYIFCVGTQQYFLRVQELVSTRVGSLSDFRVQIAASCQRASRNFYGATASAVLEMAVAYLSEPLSEVSHGLLLDEVASPIQFRNLPNRLTCADIVNKNNRAV